MCIHVYAYARRAESAKRVCVARGRACTPNLPTRILPTKIL